MKRIVCLLLITVVICMMAGCQTDMPGQTTVLPQPDHYPLVSGTFMQPGAFAGYSQERMKTHLQYLKNVGIELLVVQSTFLTKDKITKVYFDGSLDSTVKAEDFDDSNKYFLGNVLAAAKACGMQVYIGLANDGDWWSKVFTDQQWLDKHTQLSLIGAKQIYDGYKKVYPDTLAGWYFWPEYWNKICTNDEIERAADFLADYRNGLYAIDSNMPMLLSPFISKHGASPEESLRLWTNILSGSHLRSGDIFCCQDSVGAGHIGLEQLDAYFAALKAAVDTREGLLFWANNEDFTPDFKSADVGRFRQQLEITHKYTDTHISFAFCHYRNPEVGKTKAYEAYKHYFQTGQLLKSTVKTPVVTVETTDSGRHIHFDICVDNSLGDVYAVIITKDGQTACQWVFDKDADQQKELRLTFIDENLDVVLAERHFTVYAMDFYGNVSERFSEKVVVHNK